MPRLAAVSVVLLALAIPRPGLSQAPAASDVIAQAVEQSGAIVRTWHHLDAGLSQATREARLRALLVEYRTSLRPLIAHIAGGASLAEQRMALHVLLSRVFTAVPFAGTFEGRAEREEVARMQLAILNELTSDSVLAAVRRSKLSVLELRSRIADHRAFQSKGTESRAESLARQSLEGFFVALGRGDSTALRAAVSVDFRLIERGLTLDSLVHAMQRLAGTQWQIDGFRAQQFDGVVFASYANSAVRRSDGQRLRWIESAVLVPAANGSGGLQIAMMTSVRIDP